MCVSIKLLILFLLVWHLLVWTKEQNFVTFVQKPLYFSSCCFLSGDNESFSGTWLRKVINHCSWERFLYISKAEFCLAVIFPCGSKWARNDDTPTFQSSSNFYLPFCRMNNPLYRFYRKPISAWFHIQNWNKSITKEWMDSKSNIFNVIIKHCQRAHLLKFFIKFYVCRSGDSMHCLKKN